jgi:collagenase-like PrtC family protease
VSAKLTLGPVLYHWAPESLRDFYFRIADEAALDIVYLGEVVCAKRAPLFEPYIDAVAARLEAAGKEVVRSTLALVMNQRELAMIRRAADGPMTVEANDVSCISLMHRRRHVIGPFINLYNEATLQYLARRGAVRACLPAELPAASLAALARAGGIEIEVQVFGRLPLALSARCYHARSRDLTRDGCRFVCGEDPDGMAVASLDDEPIFTINGPQTLSATYCDLLAELGAMRDIGVAAFRLWPQACDMVAVAAVFRDVLDGRIDGAEGEARLAGLAGGVAFSNGFYHAATGADFIAP